MTDIKSRADRMTDPYCRWCKQAPVQPGRVYCRRCDRILHNADRAKLETHMGDSDAEDPGIR